MRSFSVWILGLVTSPVGVLVLAALDSTVFFSMPWGIDAAVVVLAARRGPSVWLIPLLATGGSMLGAALTFWMGTTVGEHGLDRYVSARRLARTRRLLGRAGAIGLAALDLVPPPFPFTPLIAAAGALEVDPAAFFITLTLCRALRFGGEAVLAATYGRQILAWLDSEISRDIIVAFGVLAAALTVFSIAKLFSSSRRHRRTATT